MKLCVSFSALTLTAVYVCRRRPNQSLHQTPKSVALVNFLFGRCSTSMRHQRKVASVREAIFLGFSTILLGVLLYMSYKSNQKRFPAMFCTALLSLLAFYLFQYGNLGSFRLKALSAEANFIRQTKQEVQQDASEVSSMKLKLEGLLAASEASHKEIEEAKVRILTLEKGLAETSRLAGPPVLTLARSTFTTIDAGYLAELRFMPSKNEPLGIVVFVVSVIDQSESRIIDFWPSTKAGGFSSGDDSKRIAEDGRQARLAYALLSPGGPIVDLKVSSNCKVRISGNYISDPIELSIE